VYVTLGLAVNEIGTAALMSLLLSLLTAVVLAHVYSSLGAYTPVAGPERVVKLGAERRQA